jgi:hypothetical protein
MAVPAIPPGFEEIVRKYLRSLGVNDRDTLSGNEFSAGQSVSVRLSDGSYAFFRYAFFLEDSDRELAAVFTEHCGYHVFTTVESEIETVKRIAFASVTV